MFSMEDVRASVLAEAPSVIAYDQDRPGMRLECLLHFNPYTVFTQTALQELFSSQPVPATFFAGKNPLVSGLP